MTMKSKLLSAAMSLISMFFAAFLFAPPAQSQPAGIGKNFEEVVRLANKEGILHIGSGLTLEEAPLVLKGFSQRYPKIRVELTPVSGTARAEKLFNEVLAGVVEFDLYDVPAAMQTRFIKGGVVTGPLEWRKLIPTIGEYHISPDGYFNAAGFNLRIIGYNPSIVPANKIPKDWADCLDPQWKGKIAVDVHPRFLSGLYKSWGEAKILDYAAKFKNNQPIWKQGQTEAVAQLASGEFPVMCGAHYATLFSLLKSDPKAKLAMAFPKEVPVSLGEIMAIPKGAPHPNAAVLLAGWLSSPEGQKAYDVVGRASPFVKESEKGRLLQKWGSKTIFEGWDRPDYEPGIIKKIAGVWGFPTGK